MNDTTLMRISRAEMPSQSLRRPQKSIAVWVRIRRRQRLLATGRRAAPVVSTHAHCPPPPGAGAGAGRRRGLGHRADAERVVAVEAARLGHQDHRRAGEEPQHDHVADGRHAKVEGEATHRADAEHEQHGGGDERHQVGGEDRLPRRAEAAGGGVLEGPPVQHLVLHPLEVDDVAVDGHPDRHDDAGDAGQRQGVVGGLGDEDGDAVDQHPPHRPSPSRSAASGGGRRTAGRTTSSPTPTSPANIEAFSESLPSVGETVSTRWALTLAGKAPRLSTRDSERASLSLKLPRDRHVAAEDGLADDRVGLDDVVEDDRQLLGGARRGAVEALAGEGVPRRLATAAQADDDRPALLLGELDLRRITAEHLPGAT